MRFIAAILLCHTAAFAMKAGLARVNITPQGPIMMAGYASRDHESEGVRQQLFAKALALEDARGRRSVMVTFDLVGMPRNVADPIAERAEKQFGLKRDQLLLNCSHTHSGPIVGYRERTSYRLTDSQEAIVRRYADLLIARSIEAIGAALNDLSPAVLSADLANAGFAVNRRRVTAATRHYPQPVDHDALVIAVRDTSGKLRGVVFGYACHATVLGDYQINGDWPGYAQEEIEKAHPGAVALFLAGCGADQNPLPRRKVELAQTYGKVMQEAVSIAINGKMKTLDDSIQTAFERVSVPFDSHLPREEWLRRTKDRDPNVARHAERMIAILDKEGKLPESYPYAVQVWRFGNSFTIVALAGEVVVDYSLRLRAQHGWNNTWVASYSNDVFAYIPSLRVLKEGGYEGATAMIPYGQPGPFAPAVEEIIVHKVDQLILRASPK
ncbi:MAG: neutral/alkaline non-lysosomal ceramidase N-terminal domain-containing protein [Bryobacterales bacterium]|nr:neutral/alkaline non-lysosomal ceramidase N-terminal domain-containing protein [Bryobacterales bacterium]